MKPRKAPDTFSQLTYLEREAVQDFLGRLQSRFGERVQNVILFGSRGRGETNQEKDIRAVINLRVKRAHEELRAAQALVREGFYRIATSRTYYDAFFITSAALMTKDIIRAKHSGAQSAFGEFPVKTAIIKKEYGRLYARLRKSREESDYSDQERITREIALERIAEAKKFVDRMEKYLGDSQPLSAH